MNIKEEALRLHEIWKGKIEVNSKVPVNTTHDLSVAYTPGVAEPCRKIHENKDDVYKYTSKGNMVAIVTDGSAVLGLGDIGPEAGLPVMEGKAVLFKQFAGVDAFPLCVASKNVEDIVQTVKMIEPSFGGINLEDISSPRCAEIERRLKQELNIPVFHDDQHGTAVVVIAALINALKIVNKEWKDINVVVSGAGAAGSAIINMLLSVGVEKIIACNSKGIINSEEENSNWVHQEIAYKTNKENRKGDIADAMKGADVFIGVSAKGIVTEEMVKSMAANPIVLAMANPEPEIMPELALSAGARIVGTGRSDFPNQINNVLAFPGIFRGALDARASDINEEMKIAAANAIAGLVNEKELNEEYIIVPPFDSRVGEAVSKAVFNAAVESGVSRIN
ncbi:NAD-dependent malic enzyme [Sedimentibacter hydroxybenzoicus DSM 7310]|uniref:NAD-dependent malic enzyme n=1 Tax=Sedimentibacter hydroxybenzoicus DSM 7310 TaxID=1123245 RepID=A0A974BGK3_SEDHY|nr:malic enzyme-like NAD(P)-binding protein [Sedimentibacter hydroxybenzoicus]NYB72764.1 NAD-dependent malic enzyme [Sedimentibacter hydroxybenzoicus DSM 7310]